MQPYALLSPQVAELEDFLFGGTSAAPQRGPAAALLAGGSDDEDVDIAELIKQVGSCHDAACDSNRSADSCFAPPTAPHAARVQVAPLALWLGAGLADPRGGVASPTLSLG